MKYKFAPAFISDFFTPFYDLIIEQGGLGKSFQKKILNYAQIKDGESILDVGCGAGGLLVMIKSNYPKCKVTGVDPDGKILKLAKGKILRKNLDIELINTWAEELPFGSSTFDLVISSLTFHHLPTEIKKQALKEIYRVLRKDGRFLLVDIGEPKTLFWKIKYLLDPERIFSTGEYMKDNLEGKIPILVKNVGFRVKEVSPRYKCVQFFEATKE